MTDDGKRRTGLQAFRPSGRTDSVTRHPSSVIVLDSAIISEYYALTADIQFENLMVHLIEPRDLLPEERGGLEAKDREVHPTLSEPGN